MGAEQEKDVYESLDTMYAALPARLREEFIYLMQTVTARSDSHRVVRRWARIHTFNTLKESA